MSDGDNPKRAIDYGAAWPKVIPAEPGEDPRTVWIQMGVGFHGRNGQITLCLDVVPIGWDGRIVLFPKKDRS